MSFTYLWTNNLSTHGAPIVSNDLLDSQTPLRGDLWLLLGYRRRGSLKTAIEPMIDWMVVWWDWFDGFPASSNERDCQRASQPCKSTETVHHSKPFVEPFVEPLENHYTLVGSCVSEFRSESLERTSDPGFHVVILGANPLTRREIHQTCTHRDFNSTQSSHHMDSWEFLMLTDCPMRTPENLSGSEALKQCFLSHHPRVWFINRDIELSQRLPTFPNYGCGHGSSELFCGTSPNIRSAAPVPPGLVTIEKKHSIILSLKAQGDDRWRWMYANDADHWIQKVTTIMCMCMRIYI